MMDQQKEPTINELLDSLITDDTSDEIIKKIGQIKEATQKLDDDRVKALEERQTYREKYVKLIQNGDFASEPATKEARSGPVTFDELISEKYSEQKIN